MPVPPHIPKARLRMAAVLGTVFIPFCLMSPAYAAGGDLDTGFSTDGKVIENLGGTDAAYGVAVQADNDVVVVGGSGTSSGLARYDDNGTLDAGFDTDGKRTGPGGPATAVAAQSAGSFVVASSGGTIFKVHRYLSSGALDTTFGTSGVASSPYLGTGAQARAIAVDASGNVIVAGNAEDAFEYGEAQHFVLVRFTSAGVLDPTFGVAGVVHTPVERDCNMMKFCDDGFATSMVIEKGAPPGFIVGRIVVAGRVDDYGTPNERWVVVRYLPNGLVDPTFGAAGMSFVDFDPSLTAASPEGANGVAIDPEGNVVLAGYSNDDFAVACFSSTGSVDDVTMGVVGGSTKVTTDIGSTTADRANALAIQADGKIVAAGQSGNDFAVARYTKCSSTGGPVLDSAFSSDGKVTTDIGSSTVDKAHAVTVDNGGDIVVAGESAGDFAVARYLA